MKPLTKLLVSLLGSTFLGFWIGLWLIPFLFSHQYGSSTLNPQLYPNPKYTPGKIAGTDFQELTAVTSCGTYSQCHRLTTASMKNTVCNEYPDNCKGEHEADHYIPLALFGADDVKNLWEQPVHVIVNGEDLGFHTKDRLESYLVLQMKAQKISVKDAQNCILNDWVACYHKYFSGKFGATIGPISGENYSYNKTTHEIKDLGPTEDQDDAVDN